VHFSADASVDKACDGVTIRAKAPRVDLPAHRLEGKARHSCVVGLR
jgi:hypothetical protein